MSTLKYTEEGTVRCIRGCIVIVRGFQRCINGQLIRFGYGTEGIILGFDDEEAQILLVREEEKIKTGDKAIASLEPFNTPVGEKFIGRIVNPLAEPLDGLGPLQHDAMYPIFIDAPSILTRDPLCKTLETGVKVIDSMIPVGLGQRELILGDKMTGKTTIVTDTILSQKNTGLICIYCAIGKARSALAKVVQLLQDREAFQYSLIVAANANAPPGQQYLAPYVACSIAEYFMHKGKDVFIGFDDFSKHAWAYREISLLLGRPPGRDSYPGDIFYLHSKMIERAAFMDKAHGGGSITFFPVVEILEGDLAGYISSNFVSMTDGQIYLSTPLFGEGQKPAVDLGLSVSRVGTKVQWKAVKKLGASLRLEYVQYRELMRISKLKTSGQSEEAQQQLKGGEILTEILKQDKDSPLPMEAEVIILYAFKKKVLHEMTIPEVKNFQIAIFDYAKANDPDLIKLLREKRDLIEETEKRMTELLSKYLKELQENRPKDEDDEDTGSLVGTDAFDTATSKEKKDKT